MFRLSISSLKNFYIIFLILFSAGGISIFSDLLYGAIILFAVSTLFYMIYQRFNIKVLITLLTPWLIYCSISFLYFFKVSPLFFVLVPILLLSLTFFFDKKNPPIEFYKNIERQIYFLCVISSFFYLLHIANWDMLRSLMNVFDLNAGKSFNNLFYTAHFRSFNDLIPQNSGFAREPGPYSIIVSLALLLHSARNRFKIFNKKTLFYSLIIVSTQSTTGILSLLLIIGFGLYYNTKFFSLITVPITAALIFFIILNVQFLASKILTQIDKAQSEFNYYSRYGSNKQVSIGRFNGILLNFEDFKENPILGYGGNFSETLNWKKKLNINSTSGLGNLMAQYGIVGVLFFFYFLYKSSLNFEKLYRVSKSRFIYFGVITLSTFSFNIIFKPLIFLFIINYYNRKLNHD